MVRDCGARGAKLTKLQRTVCFDYARHEPNRKSLLTEIAAGGRSLHRDEKSRCYFSMEPENSDLRILSGTYTTQS